MGEIRINNELYGMGSDDFEFKQLLNMNEVNDPKNSLKFNTDYGLAMGVLGGNPYIIYYLKGTYVQYQIVLSSGYPALAYRAYCYGKWSDYKLL